MIARAGMNVREIEDTSMWDWLDDGGSIARLSVRAWRSNPLSRGPSSSLTPLPVVSNIARRPASTSAFGPPKSAEMLKLLAPGLRHLAPSSRLCQAVHNGHLIGPVPKPVHMFQVL